MCSFPLIDRGFRKPHLVPLQFEFVLGLVGAIRLSLGHHNFKLKTDFLTFREMRRFLQLSLSRSSLEYAEMVTCSGMYDDEN